MSTISQKLTQLLNTKADIASAIECKGVDVPSGASFSTYARLINKIETSTQPNWDQNDHNAADYIKNRPFYSHGTFETKDYFPAFMIGEMNENSSTGTLSVDFAASSLIVTGQTYTLTVGETSIDFVAKSETYDSLVLTYIGDSYVSLNTDGTYVSEYGFTIASAIVESLMDMIIINDTTKFMELYGIESLDVLKTSTMSMQYQEENVVKMPLKYLPLSVSYVQDTSNISAIDFSQYKEGELVLLVTSLNSTLSTVSEE